MDQWLVCRKGRLRNWPVLGAWFSSPDKAEDFKKIIEQETPGVGYVVVHIPDPDKENNNAGS